MTYRDLDLVMLNPDARVSTVISLHIDDVAPAPAQSLESGVVRGEEAIAKGNTLTHAEARRRLARWLD